MIARAKRALGRRLAGVGVWLLRKGTSLAVNEEAARRVCATIYLALDDELADWPV